MVKRTCIALVLTLSLLETATAQQTQAGPSTVPDDILFIAFFMHVNTGAKLSRQTGTDVTGAEFRKIGLTPGEISLLKEIAESSERELLSFRNNVTAPRMKAERERNAITGVDPAADARLKTLGEDLASREKSITTSYMQRLESGMGPLRYKKLHDYARNTMGPKIQVFSSGDLRGTSVTFEPKGVK